MATGASGRSSLAPSPSLPWRQPHADSPATTTHSAIQPYHRPSAPSKGSEGSKSGGSGPSQVRLLMYCRL
jgi:hypothetical protein